MMRTRKNKQEVKERNALLKQIGISVNQYYNYKYGRSKCPFIIKKILLQNNLL